MKFSKVNLRWIPRVTGLLWIILILLVIGTSRFAHNHTYLIALYVASTLAPISLIACSLLSMFVNRNKHADRAIRARPANMLIVRCVASLIILGLVLGTYCAVQTLNTSSNAKFIYNGTANAIGVVTIILVFVLNALQNNMFWFSRNRAMRLDERQIHERYEAMELSYKIGAIIVLGAAFWLAGSKARLPRIINDMTNFNVTPGAFFWPFFNVAIAMFALPLLVAAFKKKKLVP